MIFTATLLTLISLPQDKLLHFSVAGTAQAVCTGAMTAITDSKTASNIGCFLAINAAGVAKELTDPSRGGNRELGDIGANLLGSGLVGITIEIGF